MSRNQINQLTRLLQDAQQLISDLDCGPLECHACVDTDDMAYIELPIDGDGTALTLADWAFALEVLMGLAHKDWNLGELYTALQVALHNTNPFETPLPDWEEVEQLMEEQTRVRRNYPNLLAFLEEPDAYADSLRRKAEELQKELSQKGFSISLDKAREIVASSTFSKLEEELEMALGEKATPHFYQAYNAHFAAGGDGIDAWLAKWLEES